MPVPGDISPYDADIDHGGRVDFDDFLILLEFYGLEISPNPCIPYQWNATPRAYTSDDDGSPFLQHAVMQIPTDHPLYSAYFSGAPVPLRPCPSP